MSLNARFNLVCMSHGLSADSVDASLAGLLYSCTAVNAVSNEVYNQ